MRGQVEIVLRNLCEKVLSGNGIKKFVRKGNKLKVATFGT